MRDKSPRYIQVGNIFIPLGEAVEGLVGLLFLIPVLGAIGLAFYLIFKCQLKGVEALINKKWGVAILLLVPTVVLPASLTAGAFVGLIALAVGWIPIPPGFAGYY